MRTFSGVALSGKAGSGKSTVGALLIEQGAGRAFSFAAALKADLAGLGCVKGDPGFREVAIAYGTTHKRAIDPEFWVTRARRDCGGTLAGRVIDDMRFANEARACEADGLLLVRLEAPDAIRAVRLGLAEGDPFVTSTNASETELDAWPFPLVFPADLLTPREIADMIATHLGGGA